MGNGQVWARIIQGSERSNRNMYRLIQPVIEKRWEKIEHQFDFLNSGIVHALSTGSTTFCKLGPSYWVLRSRTKEDPWQMAVEASSLQLVHFCGSFGSSSSVTLQLHCAALQIEEGSSEIAHPNWHMAKNSFMACHCCIPLRAEVALDGLHRNVRPTHKRVNPIAPPSILGAYLWLLISIHHCQ
jgi:hypothetical protein